VKYNLWIILILTILFQQGCNSLDTDSPDSVEARIDPGEGIDGVRFGDSKETVKAKLGIADAGGITDGIYWSWYVYEYQKSIHAGLSVYLLEEPINTAGPVDILTVHEPFSGKTKENIGIGSQVQKVREAYGEQININDNYSSEKGVYSYIFCLQGKRLQIDFKADTVSSIGLGYYKSPPNYECK